MKSSPQRRQSCWAAEPGARGFLSRSLAVPAAGGRTGALLVQRRGQRDLSVPISVVLTGHGLARLSASPVVHAGSFARTCGRFIRVIVAPGEDRPGRTPETGGASSWRGTRWLTIHSGRTGPSPSVVIVRCLPATRRTWGRPLPPSSPSAHGRLVLAAINMGHRLDARCPASTAGGLGCG